MPTVRTIDTPGLGDRSYLVHDGEHALVVDPQRDIDRVLTLADAEGVRIAAVAETHIHNDYVTGGHALAAETGADHLVGADDPVAFRRAPVRDGDEIAVGGLTVRVLHTPGHTHTHLAFAVDGDGGPGAVFSGGSLLHGSTGRPDLLGPAHTDALVHAQWRSARRLAELPGDTTLHPTHGFGSFCSAGGDATGGAATIGTERRRNPALTRDEATYVRELLAGLDAYPAYYAHMAPANLAGPTAPDLRPPRSADVDELRARVAAGEWVVDLRDRAAFAAGHLPGAVSAGLDGPFVTWLGWVLPHGTPLTLLGERDAVAAAQRELVRIGIERPAAAAPAPGGATLRRARFADLAAAVADGSSSPVVLDVRLANERADAHLPGSLHIPLPELLARHGELPAATLWVHCAGGYRAALAASLLAARGHDVVAVDDPLDAARAAGLRTAPGRTAA